MNIMNQTTIDFLSSFNTRKITRDREFTTTLSFATPFIVVAGTSAKNGLALSIILFFVSIVSSVSQYYFRIQNKTPTWIWAPLTVLFNLVVCTLVAFVISLFSPNLLDTLGIYIYLMSALPVACYLFDARTHNNLKQMLVDSWIKCAYFAGSILFISIIREIFGNGSFFGLSLSLPETLKMSALLMPFMGFILFGLSLVLLRYIRVLFSVASNKKTQKNIRNELLSDHFEKSQKKMENALERAVNFAHSTADEEVTDVHVDIDNQITNLTKKMKRTVINAKHSTENDIQSTINLAIDETKNQTEYYDNLLSSVEQKKEETLEKIRNEQKSRVAFLENTSKNFCENLTQETTDTIANDTKRANDTINKLVSDANTYITTRTKEANETIDNIKTTLFEQTNKISHDTESSVKARTKTLQNQMREESESCKNDIANFENTANAAILDLINTTKVTCQQIHDDAEARIEQLKEDVESKITSIRTKENEDIDKLNDNARLKTIRSGKLRHNIVFNKVEKQSQKLISQNDKTINDEQINLKNTIEEILHESTSKAEILQKESEDKVAELKINLQHSIEERSVISQDRLKVLQHELDVVLPAFEKENKERIETLLNQADEQIATIKENLKYAISETSEKRDSAVAEIRNTLSIAKQKLLEDTEKTIEEVKAKVIQDIDSTTSKSNQAVQQVESEFVLTRSNLLDEKADVLEKISVQRDIQIEHLENKLADLAVAQKNSLEESTVELHVEEEKRIQEIHDNESEKIRVAETDAKNAINRFKRNYRRERRS